MVWFSQTLKDLEVRNCYHVSLILRIRLSQCTNKYVEKVSSLHFNGIPIPPRQARGALPAMCLAPASKATDLNERQGALGITWYPSLIPKVGGQNMHMCNKNSGATRHLLNGLNGIICAFWSFLWRQGVIIRLLPFLKYQLNMPGLFYWGHSTLELWGNGSNSPKSSHPGTKLLPSQRKRTKASSSS